VSAAQLLLLVISLGVFVYLGVALFKAEWFG
jgi:K+-transporting ATPase KdpF subunit